MNTFEYFGIVWRANRSVMRARNGRGILVRSKLLITDEETLRRHLNEGTRIGRDLRKSMAHDPKMPVCPLCGTPAYRMQDHNARYHPPPLPPEPDPTEDPRGFLRAALDPDPRRLVEAHGLTRRKRGWARSQSLPGGEEVTVRLVYRELGRHAKLAIEVTSTGTKGRRPHLFAGRDMLDFLAGSESLRQALTVVTGTPTLEKILTRLRRRRFSGRLTT